MAISAQCPECGKIARFPDSKAGSAGRCAACGQEFIVPDPIYDDELLEPEEAFENDDDWLDRPGGGSGSAGRRPQVQPRRRPCPVCGEMIPLRAKTCRFCGEDLRQPEPIRDRGYTHGQMTVVDWLICIFCGFIGCIVGVVSMLSGDSERGGKMMAFGFLFGILWLLIATGIGGGFRGF